jgi:hypothetical protein
MGKEDKDHGRQEQRQKRKKETEEKEIVLTSVSSSKSHPRSKDGSLAFGCRHCEICSRRRNCLEYKMSYNGATFFYS